MDSKTISFFEQVYQVCRLIPYGRITSYGAIAKFLSSTQASRMVGWAMNASFTVAPDVPAHRVVNRNGMLTGKFHFGSSTMMQELLEHEGLEIENDKVVDFKQKFWDPTKELSLI